MTTLKPKRKWYADGLAFECSACGQCCCGPDEGYVWITREEIRAATECLDLTDGEFRKRYCRRVGRRISLIEKANKDCVFLHNDADGNKRCAIYAVRPAQCRTWPFWPINLVNSLAWSLAGTRCPGINRGPLHDLEHLEREKARTE